MDSATNLTVINSLGGLLSGPCWEDASHFDPEAHFHRIALPAPHDRCALRELVGDLSTAPLDHDRPLWEIYLIEGFGSGAAMLMRVHHAVADGIALARVMLSAADGCDPGPGIADSAAHSSGLTSVLGHGLGGLRHPQQTAARGFSDVVTLAKLLLPDSESSVVLKGDGRVAHRVAWSDPVDLWRVKHIASAYSVTVNDVLMAALAGALRERIVAAGEPPERLHALVPVNLRPLDEPLTSDLGNRFGLVLADLPVDLDDRVDRVWEVNRRMEAIKNSDEGALAYGILDLIGRTPAEVEAWMIDYFTAKASMVVTNVRGPECPISLVGTPVAGVLVWAPCSGHMRMTVSIFSYAGKVTVGFLTDAGVVPDPQPLADAFRAELLALARRSRDVAELAR
jgi:diacylglycerol O-acyltransferase / wax synthase